MTGTRDPHAQRRLRDVEVRHQTGPCRAQEGLLAAWRRLTPMLRLRANRYFEQDPRGDAAAGRADDSVSALSADPVERQLEQQIRLVYDRLTGDADIQEDELRRGLEAAETYLAAHATRRRTVAEQLPPLMSDLVETPIRTRPPHGDAAVEHQARHRARAAWRWSRSSGCCSRRAGGNAMSDDAQPLLVLEDAEAHLHPTTLAAMWELVRTLPAQTILTTNSGELLAAIPLRYIRRIVTDGRGTQGLPDRRQPLLGGRPAADRLPRAHQARRGVLRPLLGPGGGRDRGLAAAGVRAAVRLQLPGRGHPVRGVRPERPQPRCCGWRTTSASSGTC